MKCTALCLIGLLWSTGTAAQSRPAPSDQEILVQLERDWDRAFWAKDITFIRNVIADEFMTTYDDGSRGDKAKEIELAEQFSQKVESSTLDDFTVKVGVPNLYGLVQGEANSIAPGKRPLSSMSPTIVSKDGKPVMVVGTPGGSRIITVVVLTILNVIDYGMDIQEAVDAPRFHQVRERKQECDGGRFGPLADRGCADRRQADQHAVASAELGHRRQPHQEVPERRQVHAPDRGKGERDRRRQDQPLVDVRLVPVGNGDAKEPREQDHVDQRQQHESSRSIDRPFAGAHVHGGSGEAHDDPHHEHENAVGNAHRADPTVEPHPAGGGQRDLDEEQGHPASEDGAVQVHHERSRDAAAQERGEVTGPEAGDDDANQEQRDADIEIVSAPERRNRTLAKKFPGVSNPCRWLCRILVEDLTQEVGRLGGYGIRVDQKVDWVPIFGGQVNLRGVRCLDL